MAVSQGLDLDCGGRRVESISWRGDGVFPRSPQLDWVKRGIPCARSLESMTVKEIVDT